MAESEVTYEVRLVVEGASDASVMTQQVTVLHVASSVQAARAWVLAHATITKVLRTAVA